MVSLGCDKNLVDSEVMLDMLQDAGYGVTNEEQEADVIVVNTCSFIHDAKQESIETILEMAANKEAGTCKGLVVTGCLSERYKEELLVEMPEVDGILGASNYDEILPAVESILAGNRFKSFRSIDHSPAPHVRRVTETAGSHGYLKIAEGCDNFCTYCIIPKLRGRFRSRDMESLVEEARLLAAKGKSEIILVAQDVGKYGLDLYGSRKLPELLEKLAAVEEVQWIRLLYVYPEDVTEGLIQAMKREPKVLPYLDMPMQHADNGILKSMGRKSSREELERLVETLRREVPGICIRTTFIVGFPGETEEAYGNLYAFVERMRLDRVGVFTYSREEDTPADRMEGHVPEEEKVRRQEELLALLQEISLENNGGMVGQVLEVAVEGYMPENEAYVGRSYRDAPQVDGLVFFPAPFELLSGQHVRVRITAANEYDLMGELVEDEYSE
nr:30S ribosomal protein S12 methylthiotransferase RimO [Anaerotalea alkaliphila]